MNRFCPKTITSFIIEPPALSGWVRRSSERQVLMDLEAWCKSFHNPLEPICLWFKVPHESFADLEQTSLLPWCFLPMFMGTGAFPRVFPRVGYCQMVVASLERMIWVGGVPIFFGTNYLEGQRAQTHNTRQQAQPTFLTVQPTTPDTPGTSQKQCAGPAGFVSFPGDVSWALTLSKWHCATPS